MEPGGRETVKQTNPWQAFWLTFAFIGASNVAYGLYALSIPAEPYTGKGGPRLIRDIPEWISAVWGVMNLPGLILCGPNAPVMAAVAASIFWGTTAALVARFRRRRDDSFHEAPAEEGRVITPERFFDEK